MTSPAVVFGITADGRSVAEALIEDLAGAESLLAAARAADSDVAWAHSAADLSALGFRETWGYRSVEGPAARSGAPELPDGADVRPLAADEDSAELWAAAFRGQWGHKTPEQWPFDLPPGTVTLGLRRDGRTIGVCRVEPDTGLVDAPGLVPDHRDAIGYAILLESALAAVRTPSVTVESWGEGPERLAVCERLGLVTAKYVPGWEWDLRRR